MRDPVNHQLSAYNRRDLEEFLKAYASDIRVEDGEGNALLTGLDQMRAQYEALFEASPDLRCQVLDRMDAGEWIFNEEKVGGMGVDGAPAETHAIVAYRVRDGKIDFVRMFM